jgi:hypothetical protein
MISPHLKQPGRYYLLKNVENYAYFPGLLLQAAGFRLQGNTDGARSYAILTLIIQNPLPVPEL